MLTDKPAACSLIHNVKKQGYSSQLSNTHLFYSEGFIEAKLTRAIWETWITTEETGGLDSCSHPQAGSLEVICFTFHMQGSLSGLQTLLNLVMASCWFFSYPPFFKLVSPSVHPLWDWCFQDGPWDQPDFSSLASVLQITLGTDSALSHISPSNQNPSPTNGHLHDVSWRGFRK